VGPDMCRVSVLENLKTLGAGGLGRDLKGVGIADGNA